jgi:hypothetical protein
MRDILKMHDLTEADHERLMAAIMEGQRRNRLLVIEPEPEPRNPRLAERIATASKLRDGGEMFLDLAECER